MTYEETESKPLRQRLAPQTSLMFIAILVVICALAMVAFRAAAVDDQFWAKCVSALLATVIGCFFAYFMLFVIALCSSWLVETIVRPFRRRETVSNPASAGAGVATTGSAASGSLLDSALAAPDEIETDTGHSGEVNS